MFMACIEVFTCLINKADDKMIFSNPTGIAPLQRLSIYVDDVVLCFRPERQELIVVKWILHMHVLKSTRVACQ
jgi:hypothetical protein